MRTTFFLLYVVIFALNIPLMKAQEEIMYPGRPRYPEGLLALRAGVGASKYLGEFTDHMIGPMFSCSANYSILPALNLGISAEFGNASYYRRSRRNFPYTYNFQFPEGNFIDRGTIFSTFNLELLFNFFPREYLNAYLVPGLGVTLYSPDDYEKELVQIRPKNDNLAAFMLSIGLGADYFLTRKIAINAEFKYHFLFTDAFDAFPSKELFDEYRKTAGSPNITESVDDANDGYFIFAAGVKFFLFEDEDIDGDLLLNVEEETIGTNPYDIDTDGDGLTDYEEVKMYKTNPLKKDTDTDGLNDYVEVVKYRSDPNKRDTDGDSLIDGDEVFIYKTNPLLPDTDGDGLTDNRENMKTTNPNHIDSDKDGLNDFEEVDIFGTNPLNPDTDGEGLNDYEETKAYGTNPLVADTDGDGLSDFEEVVRFQTNPLNVDTDGDSLSDYAELREIGTNPLNQDTDDDGIPDNLDHCALTPEVYNDFQDNDGCPDVFAESIHGTRGTTTHAPEQMVYEQTRVHFSRMDTMMIREGTILTLFGVNFEVDQDVIRPESIPILEENAKLFSLYPELEVEIRGHTDSDASDEYNLDLSDRRARSVKRYLLKHGIKESRLRTRGFGERMPIVPNTDPIGKARNRRIEFYILKTGERNEEYWRDIPLDTTRQIIKR